MIPKRRLVVKVQPGLCIVSKLEIVSKPETNESKPTTLKQILNSTQPCKVLVLFLHGIKYQGKRSLVCNLSPKVKVFNEVLTYFHSKKEVNRSKASKGMTWTNRHTDRHTHRHV